MNGAMVISFWILFVPQLLPDSIKAIAVLRPRMAAAFSVGAVAIFAMLYKPQILPQVLSWEYLVGSALGDPTSRSIGWFIIILLLLGAGLAISPWLKENPVAATVIASVFVLLGMWLERWNIIVPTVTHPRLIPYSIYHPTITEVAITAGSLALFMFMFLIFFRFFPAISIWEVAEGRVIEAAQSQVVIPAPEPTETRRLRRWGFRE